MTWNLSRKKTYWAPLVLSLFQIGCATSPTLPDVTNDPFTTALSAAQNADIIILGERHDNPDHHRLQARFVKALEPGGLAFEMVPQSKEADVNTARSEGVTSRDLGDLLNWSDSGWPEWTMYAPIFMAAPNAYIAGGEIDRERARQAMQNGAMNEFAEGNRFGLDRALPEDQQADLVQELIDSHCGMIPEDVAETMAEAQRLRDASFADAALRALDEGGAPVVLIAGSGHARNDRGVPAYLEIAAPDVRVVSIGLIEPGEDNDGLYDFVINAPAPQREDPCAAFASTSSD